MPYLHKKKELYIPVANCLANIMLRLDVIYRSRDRYVCTFKYRRPAGRPVEQHSDNETINRRLQR